MELLRNEKAFLAMKRDKIISQRLNCRKRADYFWT